MTAIIHIKGHIVWKVYRDHASRYWIGVCDPLKISLQGKSLGELAETIEESLNALFHDLVRTNELDMFLRSQGWKLEEKLPPQRERQKARFELPYRIERTSRHDCAHAVC